MRSGQFPHSPFYPPAVIAEHGATWHGASLWAAWASSWLYLLPAPGRSSFCCQQMLLFGPLGNPFLLSVFGILFSVSLAVGFPTSCNTSFNLIFLKYDFAAIVCVYRLSHLLKLQCLGLVQLNSDGNSTKLSFC